MKPPVPEPLSEALALAVRPVTAFQQNTSLLVCRRSNAAALVDPGGDPEVLVDLVTASGATLEKVLLTHGHVDHASAAGALAERYGVPIEGPHEEDRFWLELLPQQASQFGLGSADPVEPDRWLQGGDRVHVGELRLDVLHCPGHTPGHVVFFAPSERFAWVGDVLFQGSIGRTDFPRGDFDTLIGSIRQRLLPLGDDVTFLPGHGPTSTLGHERRTNPFLVGPGGPGGPGSGDALA